MHFLEMIYTNYAFEYIYTRLMVYVIEKHFSHSIIFLAFNSYNHVPHWISVGKIKNYFLSHASQRGQTNKSGMSWPSGSEHQTHDLVFVVSWAWVRVLVLTLLSVSKTLSVIALSTLKLYVSMHMINKKYIPIAKRRVYLGVSGSAFKKRVKSAWLMSNLINILY